MAAALLFVLALVIVARARRAGRRAEALRTPPLLARLAIATIAAVVLLPPASRASGGLMVVLAIATGLAALLAFDALASLALWGRFRRRGIVIRAPFAITAALLAAFHGPSHLRTGDRRSPAAQRLRVRHGQFADAQRDHLPQARREYEPSGHRTRHGPHAAGGGQLPRHL